jgi:hypothetical protein
MDILGERLEVTTNQLICTWGVGHGWIGQKFIDKKGLKKWCEVFWEFQRVAALGIQILSAVVVLFLSCLFVGPVPLCETI